MARKAKFLNVVRRCKFAANLLLGIFLNVQCYGQGTWQTVAAAAPHYNEGVMLLLTDGSVLAKTSSGSDPNGSVWDKLTPDIHGSYANGTWTTIAPMLDTRLYFSSQVLKDGRVYVAGGEYGTGKAAAEIYNPVTDVWTPTSAFPLPIDTLLDANSVLLNDGKVLQAIVNTGGLPSMSTYIFNPVTNSFTAGPYTLGYSNEAAWVKLADNSILFVDFVSTRSERYIPSLNNWVNDAAVPVDLYDPFGYETGAAFLLPDKRAFYLGSSGTTAYYTPSGSASPGSWAAGPTVPDTMGAPDAAAAMMVNGKILCAFSHIPFAGDKYPSPVFLYEFDYTANSFTRIGIPDGSDHISTEACGTNMLCLPDGSVMFATFGTDQYYIYHPDGTPLAAGKPTISKIKKVSCDTYMATGKLFNGISEGASYGDDWQMATNYPVIRLTTHDTVYYAKTYNWNSAGVFRGNLADTTYFTLPAGFPVGTYNLVVTANGIASDPVAFATCGTAAIGGLYEGDDAVKIYPNPADETVTVFFNPAEPGPTTIRIADVMGRVQLTETFESVYGQNSRSLQIRSLPKGIYNVMISEKGRLNNVRLIKE